MAFSLRRMLSNISYFTKPEDDHGNLNVSLDHAYQNLSSFPSSEHLEFDNVEADSTSKCSMIPGMKSYIPGQGSLSDTDLNATETKLKQDKKTFRKLKLDIKKASQSMNESLNCNHSPVNLENTPKHKLLECKSAELFKAFDFSQSFDLSDSDSITTTDNEVDIEVLSTHSESESNEDVVDIKMCRKVQPEAPPVSATPESFADVEIDKNEEERINLLLNYQLKFDRVETALKKMLSEFEYHIEVSKVFKCMSYVSTLPNVATVPNLNVKYTESQRVSPSWNIVMEKEDLVTKDTLKNQLLSTRRLIDEFVTTHFEERPRLNRSKTYNLLHPTQLRKSRVNQKKKIKHYDFPDLREALVSLFSIEEPDKSIESECKCSCHCHSPCDSGINQNEKDISDQSITSSIGNFSLDSTTLSAYSESLEQVVSYNSFNDSSLYSTLLQKAAIERITFYIQVHSIQLSCEPQTSFETKNKITFFCPSCKDTEEEENGLLRHILSQNHCERIHFVYKTAYVKKCIASGKQIQPSTVLNPMTMYRDDNKIVCFGDALFACSLCFETVIIGESVLIAHCADGEHIKRRDRLDDIIG